MSEANAKHAIKRLYNCDDDAANRLHQFCEKRDIDPLDKTQVILMDRTSKGNKTYQIYIPISGARALADATGERDGYEPTIYYDSEGVKYDAWFKSEPPAAVQVTMRRKGHSQPYSQCARYESFVQRRYNGDVQSGPWSNLPEVMLEKCAEMGCYRKAFPGLFAGVYAPEEMDHLIKDQKDEPVYLELGPVKDSDFRKQPSIDTLLESTTIQQLNDIARQLKGKIHDDMRAEAEKTYLEMKAKLSKSKAQSMKEDILASS